MNSLDTLTTSATSNGGHARPINLNYPLQTRFVAVNGQLPVPSVGSACLASGYRVANAIICFSQNGKTEVLRREYDFAGSKDQSGVAYLQSFAAKLEALKLKVLELELAKDQASGTGPSTGTGTKTTADQGAQATAAAKQAVSTAATQVAQKASELSNEMNKANVFVFRWASNKNGQAGGSAGTFLNTGAGAESSSSGLVIVGGLRVSQLLIGSPENFDAVTHHYSANAKIATLMMEAKYILYVSDASSSAAVQAALTGSAETVKNAKLSTTDLAVKAFAAIANAQDNRGLFEAPDKVEITSRLGPVASTNKRENWVTFYATLTDIKSLRKAIQP